MIGVVLLAHAHLMAWGRMDAYPLLCAMPEIIPAKITDLILDDRNANQGTAEGSELLGQSLERFGAGRSVLLDKNGRVIAGNKTTAKFGQLGLENVVIVPTDGNTLVAVQRTDIDLDSPDGRAMAIADNRVSEVNLSWDTEALQSLSEDVDLGEWFTPEDMAGWDVDLDDLEPPSDEEDEETIADLIEQAEEGGIESRVKLGEIWKLGRHRIACGDSTDEGNVRKLLGDKVPGMVWSDPPYGINYLSNMRTKSRKFEVIRNDDQIFSGFLPAVKSLTEGWVLVCTTWKVLEQWLQETRQLGEMNNLIVWDKGGGGMGDLAHSLSTDYELVMAFNRGETIKGKRVGSVWSINKDNPSDYVHPTQKPVELLVMAFECFTEANTLIFDPFLGSAPSIIAAQKMPGNRTVYGFELSPDYCEVVIRRWEEFTGGVAELTGHL